MAQWWDQMAHPFQLLATRAGLTALALMAFGTGLWAQSPKPEVNVQGNCNATVSGGSSNVINVYCGAPGEQEKTPEKASKTLIIHSGVPAISLWQPNGFGGFMPFQFYPNMVNFQASQFRVEIGDDVFRNDFVDQFEFGTVKVAEAQQPFSMKLEFQYFNAFTASANCAGFLNVQTNAVLNPRINVVVDAASGQIYATNCWFDVSRAQ
ncbi:hypothetical protein [Primorskyibacter sp. S187A]|uniref:hypothetical protein n=1 Tax=Primorskyibacter sp. S187A TaxID=3415130 RepID=UPI003C7E74AF